MLSVPGAAERVTAIEAQLLVAHALKQFRERRGVTTRDLAARLGVSQPRVVAIEKAEELTIGTVTRYAAALGGHVALQIIADDDRTDMLTEAGDADASG